MVIMVTACSLLSLLNVIFCRTCVLSVMTRALAVLLTALVTVCSGAAGFAESPRLSQLVFLALACGFAAAIQVVSLQKKLTSSQSVLPLVYRDPRWDLWDLISLAAWPLKNSKPTCISPGADS